MNEELKKLEELLANDRKIIEENYKEIERLHTIIKEVREYVEDHIEWEIDGEEGIDYTAWINFKGTDYEYFVKGLLEILDKENKK